MLLNKPLQSVCSFALVIVVSLTALAVCPNTATPEEHTLWAVHNCDSSFRSWFRDAYNLQSHHWDEGWGWDECNPEFAFPKMLNAGYLIANGLQDETLGPWHSSADYSNWGNAHQDDWRYEPKDEDGTNTPYATAYGGVWQFDRVEMKCPGFNASASTRAAVILHEATHMVYWRYKHKANNPVNNCTEPCSDDWLFHELGEYGYGTLDGTLEDHKHSMVQIQVEFLCDLAEFPDPWVPFAIAQRARAESTILMNNRIVSPPGWTCGLPRPLAPPPPPPPICPPGKKCCEPTPTGCAVECIPQGASCP